MQISFAQKAQIPPTAEAVKKLGPLEKRVNMRKFAGCEGRFTPDAALKLESVDDSLFRSMPYLIQLGVIKASGGKPPFQPANFCVLSNLVSQ